MVSPASAPSATHSTEAGSTVRTIVTSPERLSRAKIGRFGLSSAVDQVSGDKAGEHTPSHRERTLAGRRVSRLPLDERGR
ncbi:hypothetical protein Ssi03_51510 [Sphaerisporangium siamense]|nr:hypothetical protein Ssi03_51510 [Sphaerisporangium siamense]